MKQIIFILALATTVAVQSQPCYWRGEIGTGQATDTLKFWYTDLPTSCNDFDSMEVDWIIGTNPFRTAERKIWATTGIHDTLSIPAEGWRSVTARVRVHSPDIDVLGYLEMSSNTLYAIQPGAPAAAFDILPNPNDGHFSIEYSTTALKQYAVIIGPMGMVETRWLKDGKQEFNLSSFNPNGLYTVTVKWYFDDTYLPYAKTSQYFILNR